MPDQSYSRLSQRERQIMDIIFRLGKATAVQIQDEMADPPSNSALRALLRILEEKGHLKHHKSGRSFVYHPTRQVDKAGKSALRHLMTTFFQGSKPKVMATLLSIDDLNDEELDTLAELIEEARKKEGKTAKGGEAND